LRGVEDEALYRPVALVVISASFFGWLCVAIARPVNRRREKDLEPEFAAFPCLPNIIDSPGVQVLYPA